MSKYRYDSCRAGFDTLTEKRLHDCSGPVSNDRSSVDNSDHSGHVNEFKLMEESIQDDFQGAVDYLDNLSVDDFSSEFEDVISLQDRFKNGDHVLLLDVSPNGESGIKDYRFQLLDVSIKDAESIADRQVEVSHFENRNDDSLATLGTRSVTFIGDEAVVLTPNHLQDSLRNGFSYISETERPSIYLQGQDLLRYGINLGNPKGPPLKESSPLYQHFKGADESRTY